MNSGGGEMGSVEELEGQLRLANLAEKLIIYRFKVAIATLNLVLAVAALIVVMLLFSRIPLIVTWVSGLPGQVSLIIIYAAYLAVPVAALFAIAGLLVGKVYAKSFSPLLSIAKEGRGDVRRRLHIAPLVAYTLPFVALYAVHPAPYWESYAWYISLLIASALMHLLYERPLNEAVEKLHCRVYMAQAALMAAFLPFILAASTSYASAADASLLAYLASNLLATLQEIYSAEREL